MPGHRVKPVLGRARESLGKGHQRFLEPGQRTPAGVVRRQSEYPGKSRQSSIVGENSEYGLQFDNFVRQILEFFYFEVKQAILIKELARTGQKYAFNERVVITFKPCRESVLRLLCQVGRQTIYHDKQTIYVLRESLVVIHKGLPPGQIFGNHVFDVAVYSEVGAGIPERKHGDECVCHDEPPRPAMRGIDEPGRKRFDKPVFRGFASQMIRPHLANYSDNVDARVLQAARGFDRPFSGHAIAKGQLVQIVNVLFWRPGFAGCSGIDTDRDSAHVEPE